MPDAATCRSERHARWMRMPGAVRLAITVAAVPAVACGGEPGRADGLTWRAQVDTIGDTIVVRTVAGSEWGTAELVPELRIGAVEGDDYEIFGELIGLAVDSAGGLYVYDRQVPALRKFAADGRHVGTFGRRGGGPGEYADSDGGLAVLRDGRVVLRDPGNGRFTVYTPDGEYVTTWPARGGSYTSTPIVPAADGGFYNPVWTPGGPSSLVRHAPDGTPGDTLPPPDRRVELQTVSAQTEGASQTWTVPFAPTATWTFHPGGYYVSAVTDRCVIDLLRDGHHVLRFTKDAEPVPVTPAERDAQEQRVTTAMRRLVPSWRWNGPAIPDTKPIVRALYAGEDGRIWVQLYQAGERVPDDELERGPGGGPPPAQFREPVVFDVFEEDGRYLGRVTAPARFSTWPRPVFRGEHVWGTESDELGVQYVVRYRLAVERE